MRVHPLNTLLLLSPATVLLLVFLLGPVAVVAVLSLTDWQFGAATLNWVGLANYAELWSDPVFRQSLANTLLYLVLVTAGAVAIGLGTALLIAAQTASWSPTPIARRVGDGLAVPALQLLPADAAMTARHRSSATWLALADGYEFAVSLAPAALVEASA